MMRGLQPYEEPEEYEDLYVWYKGSISLAGYSVYDGVYLPLRCKEKEIRATVFARLLERASKSEIARESRVYTLYVKNEGVCVTCDQ
jgi:hypothetical protein